MARFSDAQRVSEKRGRALLPFVGNETSPNPLQHASLVLGFRGGKRLSVGVETEGSWFPTLPRAFPRSHPSAERLQQFDEIPFGAEGLADGREFICERSFII